MAQSYFVTGTDTGVGKTWVTLALMRYFSLKGHVVVGMKPVASGCALVNGRLKNSDALLLQEHSSLPLEYHQINPYAYALAVSPHIAGASNPANLQVIQTGLQSLQALADTVIVEGAGGWYSPLSQKMDNADLAKTLNLPVILVVAIRLGCINQARLSLAAIKLSGVICAGWIAVCNDSNVLMLQANIDFLVAALDSPLLAVMPCLAELDVTVLATFITMD